MKNNFKNLLLTGITIMGLAACEKNLLENNIPQHFPDDNATAYVKFIHAYAGKTPALTSGAGPNVLMYLNDTLGRITAVNNPLSFTVSGGQYPTPSTATTNVRSWYTAVPSGSFTMLGVLARLSGTVPAPVAGDTIFRSAVNLQPGKNYTAFLSDTLQSPSITLIPDEYGTIADGKYKIRLANFVAWPGDIQEVYSYREKRVIISNVGYKTAGAFIELDVPSQRDTFVIRKLSGPSPADYSTTILGFSPVGKRAYTLFTRGKQLSGTSTTFQSYTGSFTTNY